jgi:hypothetical protein
MPRLYFKLAVAVYADAAAPRVEQQLLAHPAIVTEEGVCQNLANVAV